MATFFATTVSNSSYLAGAATFFAHGTNPAVGVSTGVLDPVFDPVSADLGVVPSVVAQAIASAIAASGAPVASAPDDVPGSISAVSVTPAGGIIPN